MPSHVLAPGEQILVSGRPLIIRDVPAQAGGITTSTALPDYGCIDACKNAYGVNYVFRVSICSVSNVVNWCFCCGGDMVLRPKEP